MTLRLVVMGVSGCGKTTVGRMLAEALGAGFQDADDLHPPENLARMARAEPLSDADRWPWLELCGQALQARPRLVLACSALRRSYRDRLRRAVPDLRLLYLAADQPVIAARLAQRQGHFMPQALLASQYEILEPPGAAESALVVDAGLPASQIVAEALPHLGRVV